MVWSSNVSIQEVLLVYIAMCVRARARVCVCSEFSKEYGCAECVLGGRVGRTYAEQTH